MKPFSLRVWLTIALIAVVVTPIVAFWGALILIRESNEGEVSPSEAKASHAEFAALDLIAEHPEEWAAPDFHQQLEALRQTGGFDVVLLDDHGRAIYATNRWGEWINQAVASTYLQPAGRWGDFTLPMYGDVRMGLVQDDHGRVTGTYVVTRKTQDAWMWFYFAVGIAGLVAAAALSVRQVYRAVNQPVQALARAARLVNEGRLDFELPASGVREMNELAIAFAAMRDGLQESIAAQAEMEQERRFFVSAIAHDLRTPLSSVRGYLEGVRDGVAATPERIQHYVAVALAKTGQLERLVQDLFAFAKTEYLSQPPTVEPLALDALLAAAAEAMRPWAEGAGVRLQLAGSSTGDATTLVAGDRLMLTRVVDNLLDNAVRCTPTGGTVTVGWAIGAGECQFWVQDTGPGIPAADLPFLFRPLFRGDKARSSRSGGAGLGLTIAQRLVAAHGGQITAANGAGGGARFTVTLPKRQSNR